MSAAWPPPVGARVPIMRPRDPRPVEVTVDGHGPLEGAAVGWVSGTADTGGLYTFRADDLQRAADHAARWAARFGPTA